MTRRRDRAVLHDPTADAPTQQVSPADRRRAAATAAEAALAGGWERDLPDVLAMLGLEAGR